MAMIKCKECGNQVSNKADKCPHCGFEKKKSSSGKGCLQIIIFCLIVFMFKSYFGFGNNGIEQNSDSPVTAPSTELDKIAWVKEIESYCNSYQSAANEIKASAVYNNFVKNFDTNKKRAVSNVMGSLESMSTDHGGDAVLIDIKIGSYSFLDSAKKNTKVYDQATNLSVGQCVIFSGEFNGGIGFTEKGTVCPDTFSGTISSITLCK
jgi:hypothetical protein